MATTVLVRHGHSTGNAEGILAGWTPGVALTKRGEGEAEELARLLADVAVVAVLSSPLQRCRQTAEALVAGRPGLEVVLDDDLGECRYGAWTGRPLTELAQDPLWRVVQDHASAARFPESTAYAAESLAQMSHRVVQAVRRHDAAIEAQHGPGAMWVAVTHGDPIKAVLADAVGAHLDHFQRIQAGPASVSVVRYTEQRPFLVASNTTGHGVATLLAPPSTQAPAGDSVVGGEAG